MRQKENPLHAPDEGTMEGVSIERGSGVISPLMGFPMRLDPHKMKRPIALLRSMSASIGGYPGDPEHFLFPYEPNANLFLIMAGHLRGLPGWEG